MSDHEAFEQAMEGFSDEIKALARQTRERIHSIHPEVVEVIWVKQKNTGFGTGPKKSTEHFCWLMPATNHVTLGFNYGAELPDPQKLLEGNGKMFRHVKVRSAQDLTNQALTDLIKFAVWYRPARP